MREFKKYLKERKVKKVSPDKELANSLLNNIKQREKSTLKLDCNEFSMFVFENFYDCLRELLDVVLVLEGYKSYSHEAVIVYLKKFNISEEIILTLNRFRLRRNNSKYYGRTPTNEDAKEIKEKSIGKWSGQLPSNFPNNLLTHFIIFFWSFVSGNCLL